MSIHFYKKGDTSTNALFELTEEMHAVLEPSLNRFEEKTGIFIDPYGKARLLPENLRLLVEIIRQDTASTKDQNKLSVFKSAMGKLETLAEANIVVEAVGD